MLFCSEFIFTFANIFLGRSTWEGHPATTPLPHLAQQQVVLDEGNVTSSNNTVSFLRMAKWTPPTSLLIASISVQKATLWEPSMFGTTW